MIIANKHSGYSRAGIRLCFAGGGVGEAMLLGAAMGGGASALTGQDPLKGALLGGLTGGAGGAMFGSAAGAATGAETALASTAVEQAATQAATQGATQAATAGATQAATQGATQAGISALPNAASIGGTGGVNYALGAPSIAPSAGIGGTGGVNYALGAPSIAPSAGIVPNAVPAATAAAPAPTLSQQAMAYAKANPIVTGGLGITALSAMNPTQEYEEEKYKGPLSRFRFNPDTYRPGGYAGGGITALAGGGDYDMVVGDPSTYQDMAGGGMSSLGGYSDGGRMLKGPGDGMSDSIPASIAGKRPARLARDEFVVPADVVSHLGNGSSDAGAKQLYAMMDKVRHARTGNKKQGKQINASRFMPA